MSRPQRLHLPEQSSKRRYEVHGPIGHGGFGTVYRARLTGPGGFEKQVAIKILNAEAAEHPELARRLRDEARMLGLVRHQAIVQVDGLLQVQGRWGIVMEYVDGIDLLEIIRRTHLPPRAALEIVGDIASALEIAWNSTTVTGEPLHMIHRDVKPSNIKITLAGEVKLLDFGIARAEFEAREAKTNLGTFGTQQYMAPERLDGRDGPASDIYALGVVLFECLTRHQLYKKGCYTRRDLHKDHVVMAQDLAWRETNQASEELVHFVGEMLAFDPEDRPTAESVSRRCDELVDDLRGIRLRSWARATLPALVDALSGPPDDGLTGALLIEQTGEVPADRAGARIPTPVQVVPSNLALLAAQGSAPTQDVALPLPAAPRTPPRRKVQPARPPQQARPAATRHGVPLWLLALALFLGTGLLGLASTFAARGVVAWINTTYYKEVSAPTAPAPPTALAPALVSTPDPTPGLAVTPEPAEAAAPAVAPDPEPPAAPSPPPPPRKPSKATARAPAPAPPNEEATTASTPPASATPTKTPADDPWDHTLCTLGLLTTDAYSGSVRVDDVPKPLPMTVPAGIYLVTISYKNTRRKETLTVDTRTCPEGRLLISCRDHTCVLQ